MTKDEWKDILGSAIDFFGDMDDEHLTWNRVKELDKTRYLAVTAESTEWGIGQVDILPLKDKAAINRLFNATIGEQWALQIYLFDSRGRELGFEVTNVRLNPLR